MSNIVAQVMFISEVPILAIVIIAIDIGVIHALLAYGGGRPLHEYTRWTGPADRRTRMLKRISDMPAGTLGRSQGATTTCTKGDEGPFARSGAA